MACSGKKMLLLGLLVAVLVVSSESAVTVINPEGLNINVLVNGDIVKVVAGMVNVNVKGAGEQTIVVKQPNGKDINVKVKDGDVVVLVPNLLGNGGIVVNVNGKAP